MRWPAVTSSVTIPGWDVDGDPLVGLVEHFDAMSLNEQVGIVAEWADVQVRLDVPLDLACGIDPLTAALEAGTAHLVDRNPMPRIHLRRRR